MTPSSPHEGARDLFTAGFRRVSPPPMLLAVLGKLKGRELANALSKAGFRSAESEAAPWVEEEVLEARKNRRAQNESSRGCFSFSGEAAASIRLPI